MKNKRARALNLKPLRGQPAMRNPAAKWKYKGGISKKIMAHANRGHRRAQGQMRKDPRMGGMGGCSMQSVVQNGGALFESWFKPLEFIRVSSSCSLKAMLKASMRSAN